MLIHANVDELNFPWEKNCFTFFAWFTTSQLQWPEFTSKFVWEVHSNNSNSLNELWDDLQVLSKPMRDLSILSDSCKIYKNMPKYKNTSPFKKIQSWPSNYRPTLLLPLISKFIKNVVHEQTRSFFFYLATAYHTIINKGFKKILNRLMPHVLTWQKFEGFWQEVGDQHGICWLTSKRHLMLYITA